MKHGCKPSKKQAIFIKAHGLNPENWFITKNTPTELHLVNRWSDKTTRIIHKVPDQPESWWRL